MKNNLSIKVDIDKSKVNTKGECPIYISLNTTINSQRIRKKLYTGYNIIPDFWDSTKGQVKNIVGADLVNSTISTMLAKIYKIKVGLELQNKVCDPIMILEIYNNENFEAESTDYLAFAKKRLEEIRKDFAPTYYRSMTFYINELSTYCNGKLLFNEITPGFLNKYRYYLEHDRNNKKNSIYQKLSTMRRFINDAINLELTQNYAFKKFSIKIDEVEKEFLDLNEIKKLHNLYESPGCSDRLKVTLHYFLLSCYTGLRLSDIRRVDKNTIVNNAILLKTQKTGKQVRIPLNNSALKLLDFDLEGLKLFERMIKESSYKISIDLNEALEKVKIKKKITFHTSRHSFAINSLVLGIPIEVVSKILGHADLKTTQIYAKVVDSLVNKEMDKWNNI